MMCKYLKAIAGAGLVGLSMQASAIEITYDPELSDELRDVIGYDYNRICLIVNNSNEYCFEPKTLEEGGDEIRVRICEVDEHIENEKYLAQEHTCTRPLNIESIHINSE